MKKLKRTVIVTLVLSVLSGFIAMPTVFAENYHGMTFTPPAGYWGGYDNAYDEYCYNLNDDDYTEISIYIDEYDDNNSHSVREWSLEQWNAWISSEDDGLYRDVVSSFVNIAGYDFVKIDYTENYDGIDWYCTYYNGGPNASYSVYYDTTYPSRPGYQELLNMMNTISFGGGTPAANDAIKIYVNGSQVFPDSDPVIVDERTLVPIRVIAEAMGYTVSWDGPNQCVTMSKGNRDVQVMVNSVWITKYLNGQVEDYGFMDVPAQIINERTYIPLRAVAEAMGAAVDWDGNTRSVFVSQ